MDAMAKVTVYLARESDVPAMNNLYRPYFKEGNYPARTAIEAKFQGDYLVEVECVAGGYHRRGNCLFAWTSAQITGIGKTVAKEDGNGPQRKTIREL